MKYLRHYDESSERETARQHKVAGYRLERTLMGCADPPSKGVGAPHQCPRVNSKRSGCRGASLAFIPTKVPAAVALIKHFRVLATSVSLHAPAIGAFPSTYSIIRHDYIKSINKDDYVTD